MAHLLLLEWFLIMQIRKSKTNYPVSCTTLHNYQRYINQNCIFLECNTNTSVWFVGKFGYAPSYTSSMNWPLYLKNACVSIYLFHNNRIINTFSKSFSLCEEARKQISRSKCERYGFYGRDYEPHTMILTRTLFANNDQFVWHAMCWWVRKGTIYVIKLLKHTHNISPTSNKNDKDRIGYAKLFWPNTPQKQFRRLCIRSINPNQVSIFPTLVCEKKK